jgi:glutathione-regulated potassium-efflux system ancillary protein KefG
MLDTIGDVEGITIHNLYEEYPDFHIDVKREQQLLLDHDIIIWHHPFYWYSAPAMIKEWIDLVLERGFAYGSRGTALKGKKVMTAITTGGEKEAYQQGGSNQFTIHQFLAPFNRTATLCNMVYLPPFVIFGSRLLSDYEIHSSAKEYREVLISLQQNKFQDEEIKKQEFMNDLILSAPKN